MIRIFCGFNLAWIFNFFLSGTYIVTKTFVPIDKEVDLLSSLRPVSECIQYIQFQWEYVCNDCTSKAQSYIVNHLFLWFYSNQLKSQLAMGGWQLRHIYCLCTSYSLHATLCLLKPSQLELHVLPAWCPLHNIAHIWGVWDSTSSCPRFFSQYRLMPQQADWGGSEACCSFAGYRLGCSMKAEQSSCQRELPSSISRGMREHLEWWFGTAISLEEFLPFQGSVDEEKR